MQQTAQVIADLAHALNGNGNTIQIIAAQSHLGSGLDALPHAAGGEGRGVAAVLGQTADVLGLAHHDQCIVGVGVHVLGGDIAAAQTFDSLGKGLEHGLGLLRGIGDNNALAAAVGQTGNCVLVGHTAGKTQNVEQRGVVGLIRIQTAAADGGAQIGVVDSDDGLQTGLFIVDEQHFFMTVIAHFYQCVHIKCLLLWE